MNTIVRAFVCFTLDVSSVLFIGMWQLLFLFSQLPLVVNWLLNQCAYTLG